MTTPDDKARWDVRAMPAVIYGNRVWMPCPDGRCDWAISTRTRTESEARLIDHLTTDPRHTDGEWIDREGRARIGFEYAEEASP